jgi:peptidoglycan-associated lipoprotein
MLRYIVLAIVLGALSLSCGSKDKKEDGATDAAAAVDSGVEQKDMTFDPMGSDSGQINGLSTVNFDYDQASLTTSARRLLADNAEWMRKNSDVTVQVEGHCDERGSVEYNLALGERRAKSVKNYLVSLGLDPKRLTVISYGKEKPLVSGDTEEDYAKNRRANFVPLPK